MKTIKTLVLVISGVVGGGLLWIYNVGVIEFCGDRWTCLNRFPVDTFVDVMDMLYYPSLAVFTFSLITFFMRDIIFRRWLYFAVVWVPLSMYLIYLAPAHSSDWLNPFEKGPVALMTSFAFVVLSAAIISLSWLRIRYPTLPRWVVGLIFAVTILMIPILLMVIGSIL